MNQTAGDESKAQDMAKFLNAVDDLRGDATAVMRNDIHELVQKILANEPVPQSPRRLLAPGVSAQIDREFLRAQR